MSHHGTLIGHCAVDSGQIMIIDPCYVIKQYKDGEADKKYTEVCEVTLSDKGYGNILGGLATTTLYGDGQYPVYAELNDAGKVVTLTIDFDPGSDDEYDECQRCAGSAEEGEDYCWRCAEYLEEKEKEDNESEEDDDDED